MREFFRGWRRKVGVMTLVVALMLMVGWVRSLSGRDEIRIRVHRPNHVHAIASESGRLIWARVSPLESYREDPFKDMPPILWFRSKLDEGDHRWANGRWVNEWSQRLFDIECGLDTAKDGQPKLRKLHWLIPYWSTTIPLILLSAFLLLKKQKTSNQKKITEPVPNERGGATS